MTSADTSRPKNDGGGPAGDDTPFTPISGWKIVGIAAGSAVLFILLVLFFRGVLGTPDELTGWVDTLGRSAALIAAAIVAMPAAYITFKRQQGLEHQNAIERSKHLLDRAKEAQRQHEASESAERDRARVRFDEERERSRVQEVAAQIHREHLRDLQARFVTAARMLGDDKAAVRIAGVTAMATLADDWFSQPEAGVEQAQACMDVLCDYLRQPIDGGPSDDDPTESLPDAQEVIVRQTIIRVIRAHLLAEARQSWSELNFDFSRTDFPFDVDFSLAQFNGERVSFRDSTFSIGGARFDAATFGGDTVLFDGALFTGSGVLFDRAEFRCQLVTFQRAKFRGRGASFKRAKFNCHAVRFIRADFASRKVSFEDSTFGGDEVSFEAATFSGEYVRFNAASFSGEVVSFADAILSSDDVMFRSARFEGAAAVFTGATFGGAKVSFEDAVFAGEVVTFNYARFSGGLVDFAPAGQISAIFEFVRCDIEPGTEVRLGRIADEGRSYADLLHLTPFPGR